MRGLEPGLTYQFRVVAVDGQFQTPSRIQDVTTYASFPPMDQINQSTVASSGWFIGMVLALIFLACVCVVVCLIKRNRGGKYAVQEQEVAHGRGQDYDDGAGFMEYTQPLDGHHKAASLASELGFPAESDTESMADYADGAGDGESLSFCILVCTLPNLSLSMTVMPSLPLNINSSYFVQIVHYRHDPFLFYFLFCLAGIEEDGSFIGKYSKNRNPEQSSAFATLV